MPGRRAARPYRAKGSRVPRLAGAGVVFLLAVAGLAAYLASAHHNQAGAPKQHRHTVLSSRVLKVQNVGIVDFGPADDGDSFVGNQDDHPLMLVRQAGSPTFVVIPASALAAPTSGGAGVPVWTDNQMADGSNIFIYTSSGQCLAAGRTPGALRVARCDLSLAQRWRPTNPGDALGQAFAEYANAKTGGCLTAPGKKPGPARLTRCGPPGTKNQEIAFWWIA